MKFLRYPILGLILAVYSLQVQAQVDLQNTGTLFISGTGGILYVNGSVVNTSTAALTNNGNLYITSDFSNAQPAMAVGTGTLTLNGTIPQYIKGTEVVNTLNLVTNNPAGLTLNNDLSVSGVHTFSAGMITSSVTPNYLRYEAGSSYTGNSDSRHVNGWVRKTGSTAFIFPVGNSTLERPIAVSSLSASSVFNAKYAGITTNSVNLASPLVTVNPNEYWIVNKVSGGSAVLDMNWDNTKVSIPAYRLADMRVANYLASNWTSVGGSGSGTITTTGTISSSSISSFGAFTIGSTSLLVPMHLLQFNAVKSNQQAVLTWTTTDEDKLAEFEVLRSIDGLNYSPIGSVTPHNATGIQRYSFADSKMPAGMIYYRLRTNDIDGKRAYSQIVALDNKSKESISIINPTSSVVQIASGNVGGRVEYVLRSNNGQILQSGNLELLNTITSLPLKYTLKPGVYFLQLVSKTINYSGRVVIQ